MNSSAARFVDMCKVEEELDKETEGWLQSKACEAGRDFTQSFLDAACDA